MKVRPTLNTKFILCRLPLINEFKKKRPRRRIETEKYMSNAKIGNNNLLLKVMSTKTKITKNVSNAKLYVPIN